MSSFLENLARRGAGLPVTPIQAPTPSPFGSEIRKQQDGLADARVIARAEEPAAGNAATEAPLHASNAEEFVAAPSDLSPRDTPFIQRLTGIHRSIAVPATTIRTSSLGPPPAPQQHAIPDGREARNRLGREVPPFLTQREVITGIEIERGQYVATPAGRTIEPVDKPPRQESLMAPGPSRIIRESIERGGHAAAPADRAIEPVDKPPRQESLMAPGSSRIIRELGEDQLSAAEPWAGRSRAGAHETREPTVPAPTVRPALAESHMPVQFPRATPASSPAPPAQLPIHVRIGRVEVRAASAPAPAPARPSPPAPLGFDSYRRVRNYWS